MNYKILKPFSKVCVWSTVLYLITCTRIHILRGSNPVLNSDFKIELVLSSTKSESSEYKSEARTFRLCMLSRLSESGFLYSKSLNRKLFSEYSLHMYNEYNAKRIN